MGLIAFVLAVVAAVLFGYEAVVRRSLIAAGLCLLTIAWVFVLCDTDPSTLVTF